MDESCKRIDDVREETLIVITVLRGAGTEKDMCRHVKRYYQIKDNGKYILLFEDDPCKKE